MVDVKPEIVQRVVRAWEADRWSDDAPAGVKPAKRGSVYVRDLVDRSVPVGVATSILAHGRWRLDLHGAHGYLLDAFLRDGSNKRDDIYGGSIENRSRFLLEVMAAVIAEIGANKVGVRLSPVSPVNDSNESHPQPLFEHVVRELAPLNLAFLHIIEGATGGPRDNAPFDYASLQGHRTRPLAFLNDSKQVDPETRQVTDVVRDTATASGVRVDELAATGTGPRRKVAILDEDDD